jgi:hypothetical protein
MIPAFTKHRSAGVSYESLILSDTPAALWMLNELSGSACAEAVAGLGATLTGTYSRGQVGPVGVGGIATQLITNAYATTAATTKLDAATLSVEFWFNQSNSAGDPVAYGTSNYLRIQTNPNTVNTIFSAANQLSSAAYTKNAWHHAVTVMTPTGLKTYIDGVLSASNANAYPSQTDSNVIYLGVGVTAEYFQGLLAAIAIYKYELSAAQVLAHYNAGK